MTEKKLELTRRRALGSLLAIGAGTAAAGAGTFAAFSDTETSSSNTLTAGTLDLELEAGDSASTSIDVGNLAPGDKGYVAVDLSNSGSIEGEITAVAIGDGSGPTFDDTQLRADTDGTDTSEFPDEDSNSGELDDYLDVEVFIDSNQTAGESTSSVLTPGGTSVVDDTLANAVGTTTLGTPVSLSAAGETGDETVLVVNYELPFESTGNTVQGDSVSFDVQVTLDQKQS